jgi:hypothetical protein
MIYHVTGTVRVQNNTHVFCSTQLSEAFRLTFELAAVFINRCSIITYDKMYMSKFFVFYLRFFLFRVCNIDNHTRTRTHARARAQTRISPLYEFYYFCT